MVVETDAEAKKEAEQTGINRDGLKWTQIFGNKHRWSEINGDEHRQTEKEWNENGDMRGPIDKEAETMK